MKLKQITFKEYLELEDKFEYNYVSNFDRGFNKPVDVFEVGEFTDLTFGQVKNAQYTFSNGVFFLDLIELVSELTGKDGKEIAKTDFKDMCMFRAYIEKQIDKIDTIEQSLAYKATINDENAGMNDLAKFGVFIQIDELAHGKIWMHETVKKLPYMHCFTKLLKDKEVKEFEIASNKLL